MRGDALFGQLVHLFRSNLHLEREPSRPDHTGMQRLVEVGAGNGDEVLDATRNRMPLVVDHTQGRIAVLHRIRNDANRQQVVHLIEPDLLPPQLQENRISSLDASLNAGWNVFTGEVGLNVAADFLQVLLVRGAFGIDFANQFRRCFRLEVLERQIL